MKALFSSIQVQVLTMQQESIARQETGGSFFCDKFNLEANLKGPS